MPNKEIKDFTQVSALADTDQLLLQDVSGETLRVLMSQLDARFGGSLMSPAKRKGTGSVALTNNTWTPMPGTLMGTELYDADGVLGYNVSDNSIEFTAPHDGFFQFNGFGWTNDSTTYVDAVLQSRLVKSTDSGSTWGSSGAEGNINGRWQGEATTTYYKHIQFTEMLDLDSGDMVRWEYIWTQSPGGNVFSGAFFEVFEVGT